MIAFGPVPSRRLGRSLGINHIPPKSCTYSCAYCQVGPTTHAAVEPRAFHTSGAILDAVRAHLGSLKTSGEAGEETCYLTFVPDGEPTLDVNLGAHLDALRGLGLPTAVITNGSLLDRADVRARLATADFVSVKVDAVSEDAWRRVNRPHPALDLPRILQGQERFAASYPGRLVTETMLVAGENDDPLELRRIASHLSRLAPSVAYVAIPTRPGADPRARPADEAAVVRAVICFGIHVDRVELLTSFEGVDVGATGDAERDLLATAAVHPLREDQVQALLDRDGAEWSLVEDLVAQGRIRCVEHEDHRFYLRRF